MKSEFKFREDMDRRIVRLESKQDSWHMNWAEGKNKWGTVLCPEEIRHEVKREILDNGNLQETYCFTNISDFPVFTGKTDIGIYATFNDNYENAEVCLKQRCHTHIFCGGNSSWVMAQRMGGEAPHLGLVLTKGSLFGYSEERVETTQGRLENLSNDRGDFILHPEADELMPGESMIIAWELFWFQNREDFKQQLLAHKNFMVLETEQCTVLRGEQIRFQVTVQADGKEPVSVKSGGREIPSVQRREGSLLFAACRYSPEKTGEMPFEIRIGDKKLCALFYVSEEPGILAEKRCRFIARNQQYNGKADSLKGAYLIYDTEEGRIYYHHRNDYNGGRERVGMGVLMARYLQEKDDVKLRESLEGYIGYVYRELYDENTGEVFNDIRYANDYRRLYNAPWVACFQLELYNLYGSSKYLTDAYRTLCIYYHEGGGKFYPIMLPAAELVQKLQETGKKKEAEEIRGYLTEHGDWILERGIAYMACEVDYEQSIVAPAVDCLIQAYQVSGEKKYFAEAEKQLEVLKLFHARQADYHQFENAIRHWDGYWFGKNRMLGDTYPHYWSALTGIVWLKYIQASGKDAGMESVRAILRGPLSLFTAEGTASCAMVFPEQVNGKKGHFYDPWANDQDWGLYFALKYYPFVIR